MRTLKHLVDNLPQPVPNALRRIAAMRPSHQRWLTSQRDYAETRRVIDEQVIESIGSLRVRSGPFEGMQLIREQAWGHDFSSRLCGTYELELHDSLENILSSGVTNVIDIGCADGYYLAGLGRRLPGTPMVGYDVDPAALVVSQQLADANGVAVELRDRCRAKDLVGLPDGSLVICDCEGAELDLITTEVIHSNPQVTFLIECHDMIRPGVTDTLLARLAERKTVVIPSQARQASDAPFLQARLAIDALDERRSPLSQWLVAI